MATSFGTLKTQVSQRIGDTSDAMKTIVGTYINQRYKDILRRTNWYAVDDDYVVSASTASATYNLPEDFGKELYVYDTVSKVDIPKTTLELLEAAYGSELKASGAVEAYCIIDTQTDASARGKKIKFFRQVGSDIDFDVPYVLKPTNMSADADTPCIECETAIEYGAAADAQMFKRQFAKAQYYEALYEKAIQNLMWDKDNQSNFVHQMQVQALNRDEGI